MREIGSEFWDIPVTDKPNCVFPKHTQWFVSGRSALQAIIQQLDTCSTVAMPSWCCDSMIAPFLKEGKRVFFYSVYPSGAGLMQDIRLDCDVLFLMDYFGYTASPMNLAGYQGAVIRDVTHSVFSGTYSDADYYFGSLRKWCGVWTGGYAWSGNGIVFNLRDSDDGGYTELREQAMKLKERYIHNLDAMDKGYLGVYDSAEECLEKIGIVPAAERDVRLTERLDVEFIRSRRRTNAAILQSAFSDWLIFHEMNAADCPMFVPILVPDGQREELRKHLIENEIYCPVHWPISEYHKLDEKTESIYRNELSLVCDQRYTEMDMYRMVETIKHFWQEA